MKLVIVLPRGRACRKLSLIDVRYSIDVARYIEDNNNNTDRKGIASHNVYYDSCLRYFMEDGRIRSRQIGPARQLEHGYPFILLD